MEQQPLHWSERAKMFPGSDDAGKGQTRQPRPPKGPSKPPKDPGSPKKPKTRSSHKGLYITLLIIFLLAAAAVVIFLWYLPSRDSDGEDAQLQARTLVREAVSAMNTAYADTATYDPQTMDPATLQAIAPSITFNPVSDTSAATAPTSSAEDDAVDYSGTETSYAVGTVAADGTAYGVIVETQEEGSVTTYYLDGQQVEGWEQTTDATSDTGSTDGQGGATDQTTQTTSPLSDAEAAAKDLEAMTLVRDSMMVVESASANVGTFEPSALSASLLEQMDESLTFVIRDGLQAALTPVSPAGELSLDFFGDAQSYALGTRSDSGTTFGVIVDKSNSTTTYYVDGQVEDWSTRLAEPAVE